VETEMNVISKQQKRRSFCCCFVWKSQRRRNKTKNKNKKQLLKSISIYTATAVELPLSGATLCYFRF